MPDQITINAVSAILRQFYDGEAVPDNVLDDVMKHCDQGFNAFSIDGGILTLYFNDDLTMDITRVYDRQLTDEEIHFLATEHLKNPPAFDPDNIIYTTKKLL
jgi:hypothetical protein